MFRTSLIAGAMNESMNVLISRHVIRRSHSGIEIPVGSNCHTVTAPAQANANADERVDVAM